MYYILFVAVLLIDLINWKINFNSENKFLKSKINQIENESINTKEQLKELDNIKGMLNKYKNQKEIELCG